MLMEKRAPSGGHNMSSLLTRGCLAPSSAVSAVRILGSLADSALSTDSAMPGLQQGFGRPRRHQDGPALHEDHNSNVLICTSSTSRHLHHQNCGELNEILEPWALQHGQCCPVLNPSHDLLLAIMLPAVRLTHLALRESQITQSSQATDLLQRVTRKPVAVQLGSKGIRC